jgi:hypothetical protein
MMWCLTFKVRTFKSLGNCCGRNLNGTKSLKLQTFRKNSTFSVPCNIEIRSKNSLKDNKIFYTYTKEQILQMKIFCDYFVMKCEISSLSYIFWNSKGLTPSFFLKLETYWFFKNSHTTYSKLLFRLYASMNCITSQFSITPFTPFGAHTLMRTRMPLLEAVHDTQINITLFTIEEGAPGFLI